MDFDIAVIGAGPAGSTLARLISEKFNVVVLDKRDLNSTASTNFPQGKNCGGLLAPDAQKMLAKFGLGLPSKILAEPQLFSVKAIDLGTGLKCHYQRHYINIDRQKLDAWLLSLTLGKIQYESNSFYLSHSDSSEYCEVSYRKGGKVKKIRVKAVVGADGANSAVRRITFPSKSLRRYLSVQEWHETGEATPYFSSIFDSQITDFYSWTIPKNGYLILGSALKNPSDIFSKFRVLKEKLRKHGFVFRENFAVRGCYLERPMNVSELAFAKGRTALVGEAGGFISPSSAEGLSYAFWSALNLAKSLENGISGFSERYIKNSKNISLNIAGKIVKSPFMFNSFLRKAIMKSKLNSIEVLETET
ncbi:FAD-binding protein [candidate division WOR-3 bacterium]|nr:FAD-binding protein [candidate division WOR-3 bacterium]